MKALPKKLLLSHLSLLGSVIIWAAAGPVIKITLGHIPPATFLFLRFLIVGIILLPYTIYELLKIKIDTKDYLTLFILGLFSQTSIILIFWAYKYSSVLDISIIGVLGAIASVYFGHYFYKDKINTKLTIGVILASIGTLIVFIEPLFSGEISNATVNERLFGNFLAILYNVSWIIFVIWSKMTMGEKSTKLKRTLKFINIKPLKNEYPPNLIVSLSFYTGLLTMIPLTIVENIFLKTTFNVNLLDPIGVFGLLYMAIFSSIAAYMLYEYGLKEAKVSDAAIYGYLGPVFTLPFAYFLVGESPNIYMMIGGAVIAIGVIIAESNKS